MPRRAGLVALSAIVAFGAVQPAAFADAKGNPQIAEVSVTQTAEGVHDLSWTARKPGKAYIYASTDSRDPSRSGRLVAQTRSSHTQVTGLDSEQRWYFEIAPRRSANARGPIAGTRHIALDGPHNTRDLGGYRTRDGRTVRWGLVYRSDALSKATDADKARLASLGLVTSVDFRRPSEIASAGSNRLPEGVDPLLSPIQLLDENGSDLDVALGRAMAQGPAALEELLGDGKAVKIFTSIFRTVGSREDARTAFRDVLLRLADGEQTPLAYNCTAGKDRTGVMSAIILTILGVPYQDVLDDFLLSNTYLAASHQKTYASLAGKGFDSDLFRPLLEQRPEYLEAFFEGVEAEYGSFDHYLRKGLRLDQKTITQLRHTLTTR